MSGYEFDVFISYCRLGSAPKWLMNHFYPKLVDCLTDHMASTPRVFVDKGMDTGVHWPSELQNALQRSKVLVAVLSAPYFGSRWCMAELRSMYAREELLDLAGLERPQGLIFPVLYADSKNFLPEAGLHRSWFSFKDLATCDPAFQLSPDWVLFHGRVAEFAEKLAALLTLAPPWQPDWPLIDLPEPLLLPQAELPRFGA